MGEASETFVVEGSDGPVEVTLRRYGVREIVERMARAERWANNVEERQPARVEGNRQARRKAAARARKEFTTKVSDPMIPAPPWLAAGETWLRQHADMCRHPSRYMA
ncbi:hypothetical protein [Methylobacterium sp. Leaf88]|uniref:hypothetical protein n=1 Tax=Methylobacterium sp. Leaf88 TaxID=1736244 RepID=UPI0006FCBBAF|nr:hypothetical protein [Methylobacterium sp. Leaf88]KQO61743.1 hypothetical protein ASF20_09745 [Methylobacterium sp. Leaf88]